MITKRSGYNDIAFLLVSNASLSIALSTMQLPLISMRELSSIAGTFYSVLLVDYIEMILYLFFEIYSVNKTNNAELTQEVQEMCEHLPDGTTAKTYSLDNVYDGAGSRNMAFTKTLFFALLFAQYFF